MSSEVPEGWSECKLGECSVITAGQSPKSTDVNQNQIGIPFLQGNAEFGARHPTPVKWIAHPIKIAPKGAILFSVRAPVGAMNIAPTALCIGRGLASIVAKGVDAEFLYQMIASQKTTFASKAQGSTFEAINKSDLADLLLPIPPLPEQKKIAAILTSVDEAIAATDALIAQTRRVKQGVLKHLLTRGIGHTRFKQTEIGEIPERWEVARLESLLADVDTPMRSGPFGSALLKSELVDEGIPFLGIDNIHVERFVDSYRRFITEEKYRSLKRYAVRPDDVVITIMGTVGRCCLIPKNIGKAISSKHIWTMSFDQKRYRPALVCWQLNYAEWVLSKFRATSQGGIMEAINSKTLRDLLLPLPPIDEQIEIEAALAGFNVELDRCQSTLDSMKTLKSALMSDLLTGRKRVSLPQELPR